MNRAPSARGQKKVAYWRILCAAHLSCAFSTVSSTLYLKDGGVMAPLNNVHWCPSIKKPRTKYLSESSHHETKLKTCRGQWRQQFNTCNCALKLVLILSPPYRRSWGCCSLRRKLARRILVPLFLFHSLSLFLFYKLEMQSVFQPSLFGGPFRKREKKSQKKITISLNWRSF